MKIDLTKLEEARQKALTVLTVGVICTVVANLIILQRHNGAAFLLFFMVLAILLVFNKVSKDYQTRVKSAVVNSVLTQEFENVHFSPVQGFDKEFIRNTELVSMGNIYSSNDHLTASYKGVPFRQADVLIQQRTSNGKTTTTTTLFKGRWLVYSFNKRFTGYLQIRGNENRLFGNAKPFKWFSNRPDTTRLKMENDQFNDAFNIYASDEHEAYYILTPHFMEKLLQLDMRLKGNLVVGFIDHELHIALNNNRDAFEPSLFRPVDDRYISEIAADIALIKTIIDELTLDVELYK